MIIRLSFGLLIILLGWLEVSQAKFDVVDLSDDMQQFTKVDRIELDNMDPKKFVGFETTQEGGWSFKHCSLYDQEGLENKAPDLVAALGLNGSDWSNAKFLEPTYSMQGNDDACVVSKKFQVPQYSSIDIEFSLLLDGYKPDATNISKIINTNMEFQMAIKNSTGVTLEALELQDLRPTNRKWKKLAASYKNKDETNLLSVEFLLKKGDPSEQHMLLRNVSVSWKPALLTENETREAFTPETTAATVNITNSSTAAPQEIITANGTAMAANGTAVNGTAVTVNGTDTNGGSNTTTISSNYNNTVDATTSLVNNNTMASTISSDNNSTDNISGASTVEPPTTTLANSSKAGNGSEMMSAEKMEPPSDGSIGYTGEIVLISLVVVLGIFVLLLSINYYLTQKNIGDYRVSGGAQAHYNNPSFNHQESYRDH